MDPELRNLKKKAEESVPTGIVEHVESVDFEYPNDEPTADGKTVPLDEREKLEMKLRSFLMNFLSMQDIDFIILQHRVVYKRNVREIGRFPMLPGRMAVKARCEALAVKYPIFKAALLAGLDKPDEQD